MPANKGSAVLSYENDNDELSLISSFKKRGYRTNPILYVNGEKVAPDLTRKARPNQTLLSFLRDVLKLTGSKLGCAEGGCGACTVMISRFERTTESSEDEKSNDQGGVIKHYAVNACLMPVLSADGCHVTTVEGVGSVNGDNLHPIQRAMVDMHGSQCGFCTPGIIVAIYSLLANDSTTAHMEEHLDGNLCRCTGYRPIWDAARSLCSDIEDVCAKGDDGAAVTRGPCGIPCRSCPERETCELDCNVKDKEDEKKDQNENGDKTVDQKDTLCCSSSVDKMSSFQSSLSKEEASSWRNQPMEMFPDDLASAPDSGIGVELAKPLLVVDTTASGCSTWLKPTTLEEMLSILRQYGEEGCKIVVGNTEVGIETKFKHAIYPRLIYPSQTIESLYSINITSTHLKIGACTPLGTIQEKCEHLMDQKTVSRIARPIYNMLRWFASTQIRAVASLGGNLVTASPISDMNPMLVSMKSNLVVASTSSKTEESITRRMIPALDFFLSYRTVDLKPYELLEYIDIPLTKDVFEYVVPFKQARRREDDISIVTSGMRIVIAPKESEEYVIEDVTLAFGGMAPTTIVASETASSLIGKPFSAGTFKKAGEILRKELKLPDNVPGGQAEYRITVASSFLYQFFLTVAEDLKADVEKIQMDPTKYEITLPLPPVPHVGEEEMSGVQQFVSSKKPSTRGLQTYPAPQVVEGVEKKISPMLAAASAASQSSPKSLGKPLPHASAPLHCTGEAVYVDDIPTPPSTLHAYLLLATECNVTLKSIDKGPALKIPGVVDVYTHDDVAKLGGENTIGPILHDEYVFLPVGERIISVGQVLGIVVGDSIETAEIGARSVQVEYGETKGKTIVSIEDAIEANSYYDFARHTFERGDVDSVFGPVQKKEQEKNEEKMVKVEGSFRCGGQEHFYLETNTTLVIPSEAATNLTIYCSTQAPTKTQTYCASSTNTPASKVVVRMKRMGGGFGGKETRSIFASCAAAVAAKLINRPVKLTLDRDVDMSTTGGRHSFLMKYKASAVPDGEGKFKLHSFDVKLFSNGGCAFDLSGPVMDRALFHIDNCYFWPHFRAVGVPCKTVQPPHTAFRGFGGPQGLSACEHVIEHLSLACGINSDVLRRQNMYEVGQSTPFGMTFGEQFSGKWNVPRMWDKLYDNLDVSARREAIETFNKKNKWKKRGLALIPTKFGIAFTAKFMNQGGALVHLYTDGTVLVTHGGTEMGQGLHTKVCQIAAHAFNIPLADVYVNDSSTDKVANTIPTAASQSTDLYGMATLDACRQILKRLEPIRQKLGPDASLREVASDAFMERIDLSAHGFYALDGSRCGFDWDKSLPDDYPSDLPANSHKGQPFNYFTQGVAYTEVEVDILSGNHRTIQADLLVDLGSSLNPMIDIGQIEGAFIQGMGWSTLEEVVYADDDHVWIKPKGKVFTTGPGTYKIPAFNDVPETFNVSLLEDTENPFAVHSGKAVGEPPFFLSASVFFAIQSAIQAFREQNGNAGYFEMRMPATSERIRMMCADEFAVDSIRSQKEGIIADEKVLEETIKNFQPKGSY